MGEREKSQVLGAKRTRSIADVLEEVDVLIDTHFFHTISESKSSSFLKKAVTNQSVVDVRLFKTTWRTLNCTPKTMKVIRESKIISASGIGSNWSLRERLRRSVGAAALGFI